MNEKTNKQILKEIEEKELVYLIPFKDRQICPECFKIYPKFRLPLLMCCIDCPNEVTREKNRISKENLKNSKPKPMYLIENEK